MLKIIKYNEISEDKYIDYIKEWEMTDERITPKSSARKNRSFEDMLYFWMFEGTEEIREHGFVPSALFCTASRELMAERIRISSDCRASITCTSISLAAHVDMVLGKSFLNFVDPEMVEKLQEQLSSKKVSSS